MSAIVDPGLLEEYKRRLDKHMEDMVHHKVDHGAAFAQLSSFWADNNFKSYETRESEAADVLRAFMADARIFIDQLNHKAQLARQISEHHF